MSKSFRIILYILLFILMFVIFGNQKNPFPQMILIELIVIFIIEFSTKRKSKELKELKTIKCKYCKSEIDSTASICPNCKRGLTFNTNTSVLIILLFAIAVIIWGILSNNAPLSVRKTVCGLGIRKDFPYCYYVDLNK